MPAYYARTVGEFLKDADGAILGELVKENTRAKFLQLESAAVEAWNQQFPVLREAFSESPPDSSRWGLLLEFPIPRRQRRIDVVLLARNLIFVIEFKTGRADKNALRQVEDYALDLADFHAPSRDQIIIPIVVAPEGVSSLKGEPNDAKVKNVLVCKPEELCAELARNLSLYRSEATDVQLDPGSWNAGIYRPVPSIVEAAIAIFSGMEVREIAHAHADAHNLTLTVDAIFDAIREAKREQRKVICFVTGVPGSGKSLAGLRAVHDPRIRELLGTDPNFLSGNGPLVKILREALVRDFAARENKSRVEARRKVETLIQNVHAFAKYYWEESPGSEPHEKIIVFGEAQRAWSAEKNQRKFSRAISEPAMILKIMDRHQEWASVIALSVEGKKFTTVKRVWQSGDERCPASFGTGKFWHPRKPCRVVLRSREPDYLTLSRSRVLR